MIDDGCKRTLEPIESVLVLEVQGFPHTLEATPAGLTLEATPTELTLEVTDPDLTLEEVC